MDWHKRSPFKLEVELTLRSSWHLRILSPQVPSNSVPFAFHFPKPCASLCTSKEARYGYGRIGYINFPNLMPKKQFPIDISTFHPSQRPMWQPDWCQVLGGHCRWTRNWSNRYRVPNSVGTTFVSRWLLLESDYSYYIHLYTVGLDF